MADELWFDYETRSRCDLKKRGTYNYAAHASTEITLGAWALNNDKVKLWQPWKGQGIPDKLLNALTDKRVQIRAHNSAFDRLITRHKLTRLLAAHTIERWYCTMTQARACALPAALADVPRAVNSEMQKDHRGERLIQLLCVPQADGTFNEDRYLYQEFGEYAIADVEAMRRVSMMIPQLTDEALRTFHVNEHINDRGLPIDTELCEAALKYADAERLDVNQRVVDLSRGALKTGKGVKLTAWVYERMPPEAQKVMEVYKQGEKRLTLNADTREQLTAMALENPEDFDPDALEMIECAEAAAAASVAKFQRMLDMAGEDGRLRGAFVTNGASGSGRFASRGAQVHNFPRLCADDPAAVKKTMLKGGKLPGPTLYVLKSMLRAAINAGPGRVIVRCDWNAIEARVLPWMANTAQSRDYLKQFNITDKEADVYVQEAVKAGLGKFRQGGKVVVLSLGYGGGERALVIMGKGYGVVIEQPGTVVRRWRSANKWAVNTWYGIQNAALRALRGAGPQHTSRVAFDMNAEGELPSLQMTLPSGRKLYYPFASIEFDERFKTSNLSYLKAAWKPKADATDWPRARAWGGLLTENADQAIAADLLRHSLREALKQQLPIIGHVHDELIAETTVKQSKALAKQLERVMLAAPAWAKGLPLAVETDTAQWFRKG